MNTAPRQPFSVRIGRAAPFEESLFEEVPPHLLKPLQNWVAARSSHVVVETISLRMRLSPDPLQEPQELMRASEGLQLLDIVDQILIVLTEGVGPDGPAVRRSGALAALQRILDEGGSAYTVSQDGSGLEIRVAPPVAEAVRTTIADAATAPSVGSAADHLRAAWHEAYGLQPDPIRAYSEAVKAVEAAAHAVIEPNKATATLGSMLGLVGGARSKYSFALRHLRGESIEPVEAMMRSLWHGQTSRHGNQNRTRPETLQEARAGVHLAAALVQLFTSGTVTKL